MGQVCISHGEHTAVKGTSGCRKAGPHSKSHHSCNSQIAVPAPDFLQRCNYGRYFSLLPGGATPAQPDTLASSASHVSPTKILHRGSDSAPAATGPSQARWGASCVPLPCVNPCTGLSFFSLQASQGPSVRAPPRRFRSPHSCLRCQDSSSTWQPCRGSPGRRLV